MKNLLTHTVYIYTKDVHANSETLHVNYIISISSTKLSVSHSNALSNFLEMSASNKCPPERQT